MNMRKILMYIIFCFGLAFFIAPMTEAKGYDSPKEVKREIKKNKKLLKKKKKALLKVKKPYMQALKERDELFAKTVLITYGSVVNRNPLIVRSGSRFYRVSGATKQSFWNGGFWDLLEVSGNSYYINGYTCRAATVPSNSKSYRAKVKRTEKAYQKKLGPYNKIKNEIKKLQKALTYKVKLKNKSVTEGSQIYITPKNTYYNVIRLSSSNPKVASIVDRETIEANAPGKAVITAKTNLSKKTSKMTITVKKRKKKTYKIQVKPEKEELYFLPKDIGTQVTIPFTSNAPTSMLSFSTGEFGDGSIRIDSVNYTNDDSNTERQGTINCTILGVGDTSIYIDYPFDTDEKKFNWNKEICIRVCGFQIRTDIAPPGSELEKYVYPGISEFSMLQNSKAEVYCKIPWNDSVKSITVDNMEVITEISGEERGVYLKNGSSVHILVSLSSGIPGQTTLHVITEQGVQLDLPVTVGVADIYTSDGKLLKNNDQYYINSIDYLIPQGKTKEEHFLFDWQLLPLDPAQISVRSTDENVVKIGSFQDGKWYYTICGEGSARVIIETLYDSYDIKFYVDEMYINYYDSDHHLLNESSKEYWLTGKTTFDDYISLSPSHEEIDMDSITAESSDENIIKIGEYKDGNLQYSVCGVGEASITIHSELEDKTIPINVTGINIHDSEGNILTHDIVPYSFEGDSKNDFFTYSATKENIDLPSIYVSSSNTSVIRINDYDHGRQYYTLCGSGITTLTFRTSNGGEWEVKMLVDEIGIYNSNGELVNNEELEYSVNQHFNQSDYFTYYSSDDSVDISSITVTSGNENVVKIGENKDGKQYFTICGSGYTKLTFATPKGNKYVNIRVKKIDILDFDGNSVLQEPMNRSLGEKSEIEDFFTYEESDYSIDTSSIQVESSDENVVIIGEYSNGRQYYTICGIGVAELTFYTELGPISVTINVTK